MATSKGATKGSTVYDPRGSVDVEPRPAASRVATLEGLRLGVLDNTKWNARKLLEGIVSHLAIEASFAEVRPYKKESFAKDAGPDLIEKIARETDAVIIAIGD